MPATSRWHDAFTLACQGYSNKQIAERMGITVQTAKNMLTVAYRQMRHVTPEIGDHNHRAFYAYRMGRQDERDGVTRPGHAGPRTG